MLSWDETIPYNAVHSLVVGRRFDREALGAAIEAALERCGQDFGEPELQVLSGDPGSDPVREKIVTAELRRRFPRETGASPFRFFVIEDGGDRFVLGVCYFHPIAGADSICWMLEDLVASFLGEDRDPPPWSEEPAPLYRALLLRHWNRLPIWLCTAPGYIRNTRRYARKRVLHRADHGIGTTFLRLRREEVDWIRDRMNRSGASFNDAFQALVICALDELTADRLRHHHRHEISVASIVNIRDAFGPRVENTFGLFLATSFASHPVREGTSFSDVLGSVREQTARTRKGLLHLRNLFALKTYLLFKRFLDRERYEKMFMRSFPLMASVTNFFVDRFQRDLESLPVRDYRRAVSPSTATPLVLSLTSFRGETTVAISYNEAIYEETEVKEFVERLRATMKDAESPAPPSRGDGEIPPES